MDLETPLRDAIDTGWCPHLAMLLRRREEVAPTLASFYALGAQRNGWLFHRSLSRRHGRRPPGAHRRRPRRRRPRGRGADEVRRDRASTSRPRSTCDAWEPELEAALARGFDAAWWARFPIGPDEAIIARSVAYDRAWDERFHGEPCVSLCLFIVGDLDAPAEQAHVDAARRRCTTACSSPEPEGPALAGDPGPLARARRPRRPRPTARAAAAVSRRRRASRRPGPRPTQNVPYVVSSQADRELQRVLRNPRQRAV